MLKYEKIGLEGKQKTIVIICTCIIIAATLCSAILPFVLFSGAFLDDVDGAYSFFITACVIIIAAVCASLITILVIIRKHKSSKSKLSVEEQVKLILDKGEKEENDKK